MANARVAPVREAIIAEARSWIGTPYHHQAALKGVGCDCLGLVRGVWRAVYGANPEHPPARHCAILVAADRMIHAIESHPVAEVSLVPWWRNHLRFAFRFPEI